MSFKTFLKESAISDMEKMKEMLVGTNVKRAADTEKCFKDLIKGLEDGKIYNVIYKDAMMSLTRRFEEGFDAIKHDKDDSGWRAWRETNNVPWEFFSPRMGGTASTIKQMEKYIKTYKIPAEFFAKHLEYLKIFVPFKEINDTLKKNTIAGRVPNPNAVPKFQPTYSPNDALVVQARFKELCADLRTKQIQQYVEHYRGIVDRYQEKIKDVDSGVSYVRSANNKRAYWNVYRDNKNVSMALQDFIDTDNNFVPYKDVETRYLKIATRNVDDFHAGFIVKNVQKLSALIGKFPLKEIRTLRIYSAVYNIESEMVFTFENGARFYVVNKAVYGYTTAGKVFVRFPTTFHDVLNSDGSKLSMPSEEKMNSDWK